MNEREPDLTWQTRSIDPPGLVLDFLAGPVVSEGVFEDTSYVIQRAEPLLLGLWYSARHDLAVFRGGFGPNEPVAFGPEEKIRICGQDARRQVGSVSAGAMAIGLVLEPDESLGHIYSTSIGVTHVAVAFRLQSLGVLIRWQVITAERERYRAAEEHFFRSVACTK